MGEDGCNELDPGSGSCALLMLINGLTSHYGHVYDGMMVWLAVFGNGTDDYNTT